MAVTQHDRRGVEAERRDLCSSAHNTRQLMSAHPVRAPDHSTRLRCGRMDDNEHYTPLFARAGGERRASQAARLRTERLEAHCLDAFAFVPPCPCRLATPHHATRNEQRGATSLASTPLIWLACYCCSCACLRLPACLPARSTRALITNTQRVHCQPALKTPVIRLGLQQSSLILPVFTNWSFSCSSNPDTRVFVRRSPRNSSIPTEHCCTVVAALHGKAQHTTRRYAPNTLHISHSTRGLSSGN